MTKDEIKEYAKEMIEIAGGDHLDNAQRCNIVQQVIMVCGMPFDSADERVRAIGRGAGPLPFVPGGQPS